MKVISIRNAIIKLDTEGTALVQDSLVVFDNGDTGVVGRCEAGLTDVILLTQNTQNPVGPSTGVKATGEKYSVFVSEELTGKLLNAAGVPLLDLVERTEITNFTPHAGYTRRLVDTNDVVLVDRTEVRRALRTGIFMVDCMVPIGRGQRELILGDRNTGKTWIGVNTIIQNKDDPNMVFIYNAIGKTSQEVNNVIEELRANGVLHKVIVVAAFLNETDAAQYYSAYLATAVAEYFRERGKDVLIVYDDLTKHGDAYRSLSIQIGQTPGREAFPGDIFYAHSRLLERSGAFASGGTITSFPIIETVEENNASYLATNIISISDGQIMMSTSKFNQNVRPAINYGPSVSRIGSASQAPYIRGVRSYLIELYSGYENNSPELRISVANTNKAFLQNTLNGYVLSAFFRQEQKRLLTFEQEWLFTILIKNNAIMFLENVNDVLALRDWLIDEVFAKDEYVHKGLDQLRAATKQSEIQICEELLVAAIKPHISGYLRLKFSSEIDKVREILEHYEGFNYRLGDKVVDPVQVKKGPEAKKRGLFGPSAKPTPATPPAKRS